MHVFNLHGPNVCFSSSEDLDTKLSIKCHRMLSGYQQDIGSSQIEGPVK